MEFIIGLAVGICIGAVISVMRSSSKKEEQMEQQKILAERRKHKYHCTYCSKTFSYEDAVIIDGKLSCPECGMEMLDRGWYGVRFGGEK